MQRAVSRETVQVDKVAPVKNALKYSWYLIYIISSLVNAVHIY